MSFFKIKFVSRFNDDTCHEYGADAESDAVGFYRCFEKKSLELLTKTLNCTIHGFFNFSNDISGLPRCKNSSEAAQTYYATFEAIGKFQLDMGKRGCPRPCSLISYDVKQESVYTNTFIDPYKRVRARHTHMTFYLEHYDNDDHVHRTQLLTNFFPQDNPY